MNLNGFIYILYTATFMATFHFSHTAPLSPALVTKLLTMINSLKAALPKAPGLGNDDKSSDANSNGDKKTGQPTSFQMDDRSPEIEVKTSDSGMDIKARPASLQVLSTPVHPAHVHEVFEDHHVLGEVPHFIAPPQIVHPIQPIYYGGRRYDGHHYFGHHHHHNFHHPYFYYPHRHYFYPQHRVVYHDEYDSPDDDYDDDYEGGDKKEQIPISKKYKHLKSKLKTKRKHKKLGRKL